MSAPEDLSRDPTRKYGRASYSDVLSADHVDQVLERLARSIGPTAIGLCVDAVDTLDPSRSFRAIWPSVDALATPAPVRDVVIAGYPQWKLRVLGQVEERVVDRAAQALTEWRTQRDRIDREESTLSARSRELDLIQRLGGSAAEASEPLQLFASTLEVLQGWHDLDAAAVGVRQREGDALHLFRARPLGEACESALIRAAISLLGQHSDLPSPQVHDSDHFDAAQPERSAADAEDLIVLPIVRGNAAVASLAVLPATRVAEERMRPFFAAANQLSLHLDRILRSQEAESDRFRSILDSMPQAVVLIDDEGRLVQCNRAAGPLLARTDLEAVAGVPMQELLQHLGVAEGAERVLAGRIPALRHEVTLDDRQVLELTLTPFVEAARVRGAVLVATDVSEFQQLQQHLAQSEKMSSLGQMISGVAHELNNPLTSILGFTQLVGTAPDPESLARRVKSLEREAERCRRIVQNLLSFARRREAERKALSLNEVVQSVLALMGYQLRVDGIQVETELGTDLPSMHGDTHQLQQVLVNLLTNARQAVQGAGRERGAVRIVTSTASSANGVILDVIDDGPGIPEEIRAKVFDPFFTTKGEGSGTGLGLSLVYGIVRDHGGMFEARAHDGGAWFRVVFPVRERPRQAVVEEAEVEAVEAPPATILVVEDEEVLSGMMADALREAGHAVRVVHDAEHALRAAGDEPDLILCDLRMPGMGGHRLLDELRARRPELARRVVLTTGDTLGEEPRRTAEEFGVALLLKPFDARSLKAAVARRLLRGHADSDA